MSLQGTLDTFSLPDVLRFLSAGSKTGRLAVDGPRGGGEVWLDAGSVVAAETPASGAVADALFELLRDPEGSFEFHADLTRSDGTEPVGVAELLEAAEARLAEWREIEMVVPSLRARVALASELPSDEVSINQHQWRLLVTIASHPTVGAVGSTLAMGEFDISRAVKELVEQGLTTIDGELDDGSDEPPTRVAEAVAVGVDATPAAAAAASALTARDHETIDDSTTSPVDELDDAADDDLMESIDELHQLAADDDDDLDPAGVLADIATDEDVTDTAQVDADPDAHDTDAEADADAGARAEALANGSVDPDDPVNRGLLLKFLSSVRT